MKLTEAATPTGNSQSTWARFYVGAAPVDKPSPHGRAGRCQKR